MGELDSIANIDVIRMLIATGFMAIVALVIFCKRRLNELKKKVEEDK